MHWHHALRVVRVHIGFREEHANWLNIQSPWLNIEIDPSLSFHNQIQKKESRICLRCAIRIRGHSASGANTNTNAMYKDECTNGETAVTLEFLSLLLARLSGGLVSIRFVLFVAVGFSGIFVQLAAMKLVLSTGQISFVWAQTFGVFVAINSNFIFNNLITFRDHRLKGSAFFKGLFSFYLVCAFGALVNIGIANIVYSTLSSSLFASLCGAIAGALWNFIASSLFTWKTR